MQLLFAWKLGSSDPTASTGLCAMNFQIERGDIDRMNIIE